MTYLFANMPFLTVFKVTILEKGIKKTGLVSWPRARLWQLKALPTLDPTPVFEGSVPFVSPVSRSYSKDRGLW